MSGLNIIGPKDKPGSKCWQVLTPLQQGWPNSKTSFEFKMNDQPACFWGLGENNRFIYEQCLLYRKPFLFTDMAYFNRWMGDENCYWRVIPNALHVTRTSKYSSDRIDKLGIKLQDWRKTGSHILVASSSHTMSQICGYENEQDWITKTVAELKQHTDRPIRVRKKPRKGKLSGPMVADVSLAEDLRDCWAIVTSCSMAAVEAVVAGVPSFAHAQSPAVPVSSLDIAKIETPVQPDRQMWVNTLAYYQFNKTELASGLAKELLEDLF